MIMKAVKKPIEVEVYQWLKGPGSDVDCTYISLLIKEHKIVCKYCELMMKKHGWISALDGGGRIVCPGDWIITEAEGEKYPCKPGVFKKTYQLING